MLRFAPSPTGDMDITHLRVAILNYLVAQQKGEQFLVRIEDSNAEHNITGKDTEIMMLLEKFALKHDAVFHQSEHLNLYQTLAIQLLKSEKAFVCKCMDESSESYPCSGKCENLSQEAYTALKALGEKFVVRLKKPLNTIIYHDSIQGDISATPEEIDAVILLKSDGLPSYNFACAADDMMSDISLIIRDESHLGDTARQIHIKNLLGYEHETQYAHLPNIVNSDEAYSIKWLFEQGFLPDAILNYLILLGNPQAPQEIFTLPQAIAWFDLEKISKSAAKFDMDKLRFINREHLKMMDDKQLSTLFGFADADIGKLAKVYLKTCRTINELEAKIRPIFSPKNFDGAWGEQMRLLEKIIFNAPAFETFDTFQEHIINKSGLKEEELIQPLRYLLTAAGEGPELSEIYPYIKSYILEVAS